jgi:hypothetical protein
VIPYHNSPAGISSPGLDFICRSPAHIVFHLKPFLSHQKPNWRFNHHLPVLNAPLRQFISEFVRHTKISPDVKVSAWDAQFDIQNNLVTVKPGSDDAVRLAITRMADDHKQVKNG